MQHPRALALAVILAFTGTAVADDTISTTTAAEHEQDDQDGRRAMLFSVELGTLLGLSAGWYWLTADDQMVDWTYPSWRTKLTSFDAVRFDTNPFAVNAFGHTAQSVIGYSIARGNGLGMLASSLVNFGVSAAWEYTVEYREYVSLNDLVVNTISGPALAEPLYRVGEYFRSGEKTTMNEVFAAIFSPFEDIERRVDHRSWRTSAQPWHRFRLSAGATTAVVPGDQRIDAAVGADLEVASFDRSGARSGTTPPGGWSRIAGDLRFGADGLTGARVHSRTSYAGYQSRAVYEDGFGRSAFIGIGTGLTYELSELGEETDQIAAYHLLGPQLDLHLRRQTLDLRWQNALYGDFGIVHAHALGAMPPVDPTPPFEDPVAAWNYYYGMGATASTRLLVDYARWNLDVEANLHQLWSLDHKDADRGQPEGAENLADGRLFGRAALGYEVIEAGPRLEGTFDVVGRRGTLGDVDRRTSEQRYGLQLTLQR